MYTRKQWEKDEKYLLPNLRYRYPNLSNYSDEALCRCYHDFALSDDYGNNDEKFLLWFEFLPLYEDECEFTKDRDNPA